MKKIRVLIIDNDSYGRETLGKILSSDKEIEIMGTFPNTQLTREKISQLQPNLITLDLSNSFAEALKTIEYTMAHSPRPIVGLTLTGCVGKHHSYLRDNYLFRVIESGALEILEKPNHFLNEQWIKEIKLLSRVKVITHLQGRLKGEFQTERMDAEQAIQISKKNVTGKFIALASSTGGPKAIKSILSNLSPDFPSPLGIVQHMPEGFMPELINWLNQGSWIKVKEAEDGEPIKPDFAYLAPARKCMTVEEEKIRLLDPQCGEEDYFICPSADIFFSSVAKVYGPRAIAVVLTGMGKDGAEGIKEIKKSGGKTIAQDEKSSLIFGMPQAAIDSGAVEKVLPLELIPREIIKSLS